MGRDDEQARRILANYREARMKFGLDRLHLGAYLYLIRENRLWEGEAETWEAFLAAENLQPHAIRQYISAARKFIIELDLPPETLRKMSLAGISALEKAGRIINESNKDEVISTLTSLPERDAIERIVQMSSGSDAAGLRPEQPSIKVLSLLRQYHDMPPDMQAEFFDRLNRHRTRTPLARAASTGVRGHEAAQDAA